MVNVCYLCKFQPFEDRKVLKLEVMNELTNLLLLYHVCCFAGLVPDSEDRYMLGWSFIATLACNMLVHFVLLVISTVVTCKTDFRKKCCAKKQPEEEPVAEPEPKKDLTVILEESSEF